MSKPNPKPPVMELRVALTTDAFERLVSFYCDGLGLEPAQVWPDESSSYSAPNATDIVRRLISSRAGGAGVPGGRARVRPRTGGGFRQIPIHMDGISSLISPQEFADIYRGMSLGQSPGGNIRGDRADSILI